MNFFNNFSIRTKLLVLVSVACLGLIYLSILELQRASSLASNDRQTARLLEINIANSKLVHELQKERGLTAGYMGSKGSRFAEQLNQQLQLTNEVLRNRQNRLQSLLPEVTDTSVLKSISDLGNRLDRLAKVRSNVQNLNISLPDAIGFYTQTNALIAGHNTADRPAID